MSHSICEHHNLRQYCPRCTSKSPVIDNVIQTLMELNASPRRTSRMDIWQHINSERDYQDTRWPGHTHEIESYLVYIESYLNEAKQLLSRNDKDHVLESVQHILRKIAALAVVCMEEHGSLPRKMKTETDGSLSEKHVSTQTIAFACIGHVYCKKGDCQTYCGTCREAK